MEYAIKVSSNDYSGRAEVGPIKEDGQFVFGTTAEVFWGSKFGGPVEVEVSFAAIGSHDAGSAKVRLQSYQYAIDIAEIIEGLLVVAPDPVLSKKVVTVSDIAEIVSDPQWQQALLSS